MRNLSFKHKIYIAYFVLAWPLMTINDDAPLWAIALVVLNFINAGRLVMRVPIKRNN